MIVRSLGLRPALAHRFIGAVLVVRVANAGGQSDLS